MRRALALLLLAGAARAEEPRWSFVAVRGWAPGGAAVTYSANLVTGWLFEDGDSMGFHGFLVVADPDGKTRQRWALSKILSQYTIEDKSVRAEGEALWASASVPSNKDPAWNELEKIPGAPELVPKGKLALAGGKQKASVKVQLSGDKACPTAQLWLTRGATSSLVFEDPCPGGAAGTLEQKVTAAWSPSKELLALGWTVGRVDETAEARFRRGYFAVATKRALATIDLLDAGAGPKADTIAESLGAAGFRVLHRAKAVKARDASAVYFAPGFEAEAREIAGLAGAKTVEKLSWKSPYAITVAAAQ